MKQRKETPNSSDLPIYLFKQGNNQDAYRYFGAHLCEQNGEAGVVFRADGAPALVYALFADSLGHADDYGGTHPAVRAHAALGRAMLDAG